MPRKGFSNFDEYDDGFDDDDAYDYDDEYDIEDEHEAAAEQKEEKAQQGVWRCAICTYDNEEGMFVCDICGVLRHPVAGGNQTINKNTGTVSSLLSVRSCKRLQISLADCKMGSCLSVQLACNLDQALKHACGCLGGEVSYVCSLEKHLAALDKAMKALRAKRADVLSRVKTEEHKDLERLNVVQLWLTNVENIQNQVDGLLQARTDELERLRCCGLCTKNLRSSRSYGKKVFEMLKEVEDLKSEGVFEAVAGPPTMAVMVEELLPKTIIGQGKMLERAWNHLMDDETEIMGLYGMGGVGKTTLLKQINNKFRDENIGFEIVIWVVVSSNLRVEKIQDEIAEKLNLGGEEWKRKDKRQKVTALYTHLQKKKFVLLLDDIWKEVDLTEIGVPSPTKKNGCKVVFTTRSREVCGHMTVDDPMEVRCLDSDEAWDLFRSRVGKNTLESHPDILELACTVARKCRGLPLALNIIGKNMASKRTVEEWEEAIDTLASSAAEFPGMKDHIFPVLMYSYDSLKDEVVKSCFLYCALFPEDSLIEKEKLVDYWICEGFIDGKQGKKKARNKAYGVMGTLVASLLIEEGAYGIRGLRLKMHDVVREMALWIASDFGKHKERWIVQAGVGLLEVPTVENWRSVRRMSLIDNKIENISGSPDSPELTTLLIQKNKILNISGEFFKSMPMLAVLDLSGSTFISGFPMEISKLASLRYLDLSDTKGIKQLHQGIQDLIKLTYLNMEGSELESISVISTLSSLRTLGLLRSRVTLDINGIKELQLLQHLEEVTITIDGSSLVAEQLLVAPKLANSIRKLCIKRIEEASVLTLPNMPLLDFLMIEGCKIIEINIERTTPSSSSSSSWNRNPTTSSFPSLGLVYITDCHGLTDLTWLLFAPNLQILRFDECSGLEYVISKEKAMTILTEEEAGNIIPFQKLLNIYQKGVSKLKSIFWSPVNFPCLETAYVPDLEDFSLVKIDGSYCLVAK